MRTKDNGEIYNEMEDRIMDALEQGWIDIGGGDLKFCPVDAAEVIQGICEDILERYDI